MEKCFKVAFHAKLIKLTLAFKMECQIQALWKRGEKIAQSSKIPFSNATGYFDEKLTISCNMMFDPQQKTFKEKLTKFAIVLYTPQGTKQAGEIVFDVAPYLNQRNKKPKPYEMLLSKCPDKNAKLYFDLSAQIQEEIALDTISCSSAKTVAIEKIVNNDNPMNDISTSKISNAGGHTDRQKKQRNQKKVLTVSSIEESIVKNSLNKSEQNAGPQKTAERIKFLEAENRKIKEKLQGKDKLKRQIEELRKKIKNDEFQEVKQIKTKIQNVRKDIQKYQSLMKKQAIIEKQSKQIEDQIFKCKLQIMNSFNYANQVGGGRLLNEIQQACGLKEV